ncbi:hypothetical protein QEM13_002019 [Pseudomonas putida]|nr:hypothetical protein [Pseudomonas putida]
MNYEPQTRQPRGVDLLIKRQNGVCDVCGKSRAHFKHVKCAKARKAAGFYIRKDKAADTKVRCVQCRGVFRHDTMMGNTCRGCYAAMYGEIFGAGEVSHG